MATTTITPPASLITTLQSICHDDQSIRQELISYILESYSNDEEICNFFHDLLSHGCASGIIPFLIYYHDTHEFFDRHYDEIEDLRKDYEADTGQSLTIKYDLKNHLAWFGFEETACRLADELEIDW